MPIEIMEWITREDLKNNPDKVFVFGDNISRTGYGGQARSMRGEPNALGVATKAKAEHGPDAYMDDTNSTHWKELRTDMQKVEEALRAGKTVVWPADGIGTGLAKLKDKAPVMYEFIQQMLQDMIRRYGFTSRT